MKAQKKLNVLLVVLVIILLSLISFVGIFYQNKNIMQSMIPDYILGTDLKGYRAVSLVVEESDKAENTNETKEVLEDSINEIEESEATKDNDNLSKYKKSVDVFKARFKSLRVEEYTISYDENSGKIELTLPEDERTDIILADLTQKGEFKIVDTKTQEVLMDNNDIGSVELASNTDYDGNYTAYMSINFNMGGTNKLRKITTSYQNQIEEDTTSKNSIETNEVAEESEEESYSGSEEAPEDEEEPAGKTIDMKIDDSTIMTTGFSSIIDSGTLNLSFGSADNLDDLQEKLYNADNVASIIENEPLPLQYTIEGNTYVKSLIDTNIIRTIIYIEIAISLLVLLCVVIKYKAKGILSAIISVGYLAILLLIIRYTNVILSIEGIFAIEASFIINIITQIMVCNVINKTLTKKEKNKELNKVIKRISLYLIPEMIFAVVCCLSSYLSIFSVGMVTFWGIVISWIYNYVLVKIIA